MAQAGVRELQSEEHDHRKQIQECKKINAIYNAIGHKLEMTFHNNFQRSLVCFQIRKCGVRSLFLSVLCAERKSI